MEDNRCQDDRNNLQRTPRNDFLRCFDDSSKIKNKVRIIHNLIFIKKSSPNTLLFPFHKCCFFRYIRMAQFFPPSLQVCSFSRSCFSTDSNPRQDLGMNRQSTSQGSRTSRHQKRLQHCCCRSPACRCAS